MNITVVLAQILGIMFVVIGLSMLFNKKWTFVAVKEIITNQGLLWMGGLIAVIMGAVIIALNNVWTSGLPLFVTILGWLTLIKGVFILVFPSSTISYYRKMNKGNIFIWGGIFVLILGLILTFQ